MRESYFNVILLLRHGENSKILLFLQSKSIYKSSFSIAVFWDCLYWNKIPLHVVSPYFTCKFSYFTYFYKYVLEETIRV